MPRAYWKGYLRLSLVTCPIELFPATSQSEKTHFHQINEQTGHRLRHQMVDEETGRAVDRHRKPGIRLRAGTHRLRRLRQGLRRGGLPVRAAGGRRICN